MRHVLAVSALLLVLLAARPAAAQTTVPPVTAVGTLPREAPPSCISAYPDEQECDSARPADGRTLVLFGILMVGLSGIGFVIVRSTLRTTRQRRAAASR